MSSIVFKTYNAGYFVVSPYDHGKVCLLVLPFPHPSPFVVITGSLDGLMNHSQETTIAGMAQF